MTRSSAPEQLISQEEIAERVEALAKAIAPRIDDDTVAVCLFTGGIWFAADLTRALARIGRNVRFDGLMRDGYAVAAIRCGKPYTEMSDAWFRISGAGKQPAILYRAMYRDGGKTTETYVLRIDNVMPPIQPGQGAPTGGRCPG